MQEEGVVLFAPVLVRVGGPYYIYGAVLDFRAEPG